MYFIGNIITWRTLALIGNLFLGPLLVTKLWSSEGKSVKTIKLVSFSGTTPCLVQLMGLFFVPESPRWLVGPNILMGM